MKAVVVVSFGSSVKQARECLGEIEHFFKNEYSGRDCFSAYTSGFIRRKLKEQGEQVHSPEELLQELKSRGYTDIILHPTHIIPGQEYDKLIETAGLFTDSFTSLQIMKPLLCKNEDLVKLVDVISSIYKVEENQALVLMGHGTEHVSNFIYPALQTAFRTRGIDNAYVATIEGWPSISDAISQMKKSGISKAFLAPLLLVAGDHVINDMIGDQEDSWINQLKLAGIETEYCTKGIGSYKEILELYLK